MAAAAGLPCCRRAEWDVLELRARGGCVDYVIHLRSACLGCAPGEVAPPCARRRAAPAAGGTWDSAAATLRSAWLPFWYARLALVCALLIVALRAALPRAPAPAALAAALCAAWLLLPRRVVAERVQALPGGGLLCTALREDGMAVARAPLPPAALAGVALREGLRRCGVEWYLCAVVRGGGREEAGGAPQLFLPLQHARPRLVGLVRLLRALRAVFPVGAQ